MLSLHTNIGWLIALAIGLAQHANETQAQKTMRFGSSSMEPSIVEGAAVTVNMLAYLIAAPKRWDIIVFQTSEGKFYAHRVIGLPGELIEYDQSKRLKIDGSNVKWSEYANSVSCKPRENSCREFIEGTGTDRHLVRVIDGQPPVMWLAVPDFDGKNRCSFSELGFSCKVPPESYFVMGDNRDKSLDSRYLGFVPANRIGGRIDGIPWVK